MCGSKLPSVNDQKSLQHVLLQWERELHMKLRLGDLKITTHSIHMTAKDAHEAERLGPSGTSRRMVEFEHCEYKLEDEGSFYLGKLSLQQV